MKTFTMYRRADISKTHNEFQANPPHLPQFEGVIFSDGRCAIRWLTAKGSTSVWDSFDDMMAIHGHPEYDSELVFDDKMRCSVDGDALCIVRSDFVDLQESPSFFIELDPQSLAELQKLSEGK